VEGDLAPAFRLACFDSETQQMLDVSLADSAGEVRLLNVVSSLDTPACHVETRRWEQLRADLPPDLRVYTISMVLPSPRLAGEAPRASSTRLCPRMPVSSSPATTASCSRSGGC
jgi:hypothetical protein